MSLLPLFNLAAKSATRTASTSVVHSSFLPRLIAPAYPASSLLSLPASLSSSSSLLSSVRCLSAFAPARPASSFDPATSDPFDLPHSDRASSPLSKSSSSIFTPRNAAPADDNDGVFIPARQTPHRSNNRQSPYNRNTDRNNNHSSPSSYSPSSSSSFRPPPRTPPTPPTSPSPPTSPLQPPPPGSLNPDDFPMDPRLRESLRTKFRISAFFPIQATAYVPIVEGKDVLARSKTGTGKTLAFVLPLLERLKRERVVARKGEISILVMEPTRELANQVTQEIEKLSPETRVCAVYGGVGYGPQTDKLLRGVDVCVGTPGRLMDLLDKGACSLREVRAVVLDEADEMLRRGFKEDMENIMGYANRQRKAQMLLFSATLPDWIQQVSQQFQSEPVLIDQVSGEENTTPLLMDHIAISSPRLLVDRLKLIGELARGVRGRVILFVNSKVDADTICSHDFADELGVDARALHGDVPQARRDRLMQGFKAGHYKMLVATDIAARGLDIPDVQLVLQNGLPSNKEFYVHRAGRTARAGKAGRCVILYRAPERQDVGALGRELGVHFSFQAPPPVNGEHFSAVSGEPGYMTFISQSAAGSRVPTRDEVVSAMEEIIKAPVLPGSVERLREAVVIDVPAAQGKQIAEALSSRTDGLPLAVLTELPDSMVGNRSHYQGFGRGSSGQRTGGGQRGGGGGGGGGDRERGSGGGRRDQRGGGMSARGNRQQGRDGRGDGRGSPSAGRGGSGYGRSGYEGGRSGGYKGRSNADSPYRTGSRFGNSAQSETPFA